MARSQKEDWRVVLFMPMAFSILGGIVVLGIQSLVWLKSGIWTDMTVQDALGHPLFSATTRWVGINRILQWVDTEPLWHWFLLILPWLWLPIGLLACWHIEGWINPTQENLAGRLLVTAVGLVGAFIGVILLFGWLKSLLT